MASSSSEHRSSSSQPQRIGTFILVSQIPLTASRQNWATFVVVFARPSLNRLRTGVGQAKTTTRKWRYFDETLSTKCTYGEDRTMSNRHCCRLLDDPFIVECLTTAMGRARACTELGETSCERHPQNVMSSLCRRYHEHSGASGGRMAVRLQVGQHASRAQHSRAVRRCSVHSQHVRQHVPAHVRVRGQLRTMHR